MDYTDPFIKLNPRFVQEPAQKPAVPLADAVKQALVRLQEQAYEAMYEAWRNASARHLVNGRVDYEATRLDPETVAGREAYEKTVDALVAHLGPDAHCGDVDIDLWSTYSDFFKSENGFRPRWHVTREKVRQELSATEQPKAA